MEEILVIGHRHPDTDSICSALAYAALKNAIEPDEYRYVAGAADPPNAETMWVLDVFGVSPPVHVQDVHTRVKDVARTAIPKVAPSTPLRVVHEQLLDTEHKLVCVVDERGLLAGIVTAADIARAYIAGLPGLPGPADAKGEKNRDEGPADIPPVASPIASCSGQISVDDLLVAVDGDLISGSGRIDAAGRVVIAAMGDGEAEGRICEGDVVVVGNQPKIQEMAAERCGCLILPSRATLAEAALVVATRRGIPVISAPHDAYTLAWLMRLALPVCAAMTTDVISFYADDLIMEIERQIREERHRAYPVITESGTVYGVLNRGDLLRATGKKVILVDHNEVKQAVQGIEEATIVEILDHHRLGDIETSEPAYIRCDPVGSTSTLVFEAYREKEVDIPAQMAGILLGAILSDTLILRSPTTTARDVGAAQLAAAKAGVNIQDFGIAMFTAGSRVRDAEPRDLIFRNFKEFGFPGARVGISQLELVDLGAIRPLRGALAEEMEEIAQQRGMDAIILMLTDVLAGASELIVRGRMKPEIARAFGAKAFEGPERDSLYLPGVVSRKKQVVPRLARAFGR